MTSPVFNLTELDIGTNDHVMVPFSVPAGNVLNSFYHFITHQTNAAVLFEIFGLQGDADLLVRRSDLPSRDLYDFSFLSTGPGSIINGVTNTGYEPIPLRTNLFIPTLGVNTNWYIALINRTYFTNATGTLCVKVFTNLNPIVGCAFNTYFDAPVVPGGPIDICWDSQGGNTYNVESTTDLINWTPVPGLTNIAANPPKNCALMPTNAPVGFFRIRAY